MSNSELDVNRHEKAEMLRQDILTSYALVQKNLWDMCMKLKEMRDEKLYKELGYSEFNDFTTSELNMSDRNVYRYIAIAEKVDPELVTPVSLIGVKKLSLLTMISKEEQHGIAEKVDFDKTSYEQLKEEINRLKGEKMKIENEREKLNAKLEAEAENAEDARRELKAAQIKSAAEMDRANRTAVKLQDLQRDNARLAKENKELRSRPVEVAAEDRTDEYEKKLAAAIEDERKKSDTQVMNLTKDFREKVTALREEYEEKLKAAAEDAAKQSETPPAAASVSVYDKEKEQFKIYLVTAHDAIKRLVEFANSHDNRVYLDKAGELFAASAAALKEV